MTQTEPFIVRLARERTRCWHHACADPRGSDPKYCPPHRASLPADVERARAWLLSMGGVEG